MNDSRATKAGREEGQAGLSERITAEGLQDSDERDLRRSVRARTHAILAEPEPLHAIDVASVDAIIRGAIRALGGRA